VKQLKWRGPELGSYPGTYWYLFAGTVVSSVGYGMVYRLIALFMQARLGLTATEIGLIMTAWSATGLVSRFLGGYLADRYGRRPLILISLLAETATLVAFLGARDLYTALVISALSGIFGPLYEPASTALVADLVETHRRPQAYSLLRAGFNVGMIVGPPLGGVVAALSFDALFLLAALCVGCFLVIAYLRIGDATSGALAAPVGAFQGYSRALGDPWVVAFLAANLVVVSVYSQTFVALPLYMKAHLGIGEVGFGFLSAVNAALVVALQYPFSALASRWRYGWSMAAGSVLQGIGTFAFGLATDLGGLVAGMVVLSLGEVAFSAVNTAWLVGRAPEGLKGTYAGLSAITFGLGLGVGPLLGGWVQDAYGSPTLWQLCLGSSLVAAAGLALLQQPPQGNKIALKAGGDWGIARGRNLDSGPDGAPVGRHTGSGEDLR
jgi:MFS family permease